jgi:hypothetical protein
MYAGLIIYDLQALLLNEFHQIACLEPSIVEHIDEDLDLTNAKKKKLLRLADA